MRTASWVIVNNETGEALFETFVEETARKCERAENVRAVPILEYLQNQNRRIKENGGEQP